MTRVGLVGCGTIGSALAKAIERNYADVARVVALCDSDFLHAQRLQQKLSGHPPIVSLSRLLSRSDLILEAASASISCSVARRALSAGCDCLVMSTGGLLGHLPQLARAARRSHANLLLPSGALGGLDAVKALSMGMLRRVRLTTRKPPRALAGSPFAITRRLRLNGLRQPRIVFTGSPSKVVRAFPQNTNVAATVALACARSGFPTNRIQVRVVADPSLRRNVHELSVIGDAGQVEVRIESRPSRDNPKTSETAIRSALAVLDQAFGSVRIGT